MTLHIDRFAIRCRAAPQAQMHADAIERVVREQFVRSCADALAPALHACGGVVRIRRLNMRLCLRRDLLGDAAFAREWAGEFAAALGKMLALPAGSEPGRVVRFENRAQWLAEVIEALLTRSLTSRWQFTEYVWLAALPVPRALCALLANENAQAALQAAARRGCSRVLLQNLDAAAIEQLCRQIESTERTPRALTLDEWAELSAAALAQIQKEPLRSLRDRWLAFALWLTSQRTDASASLRSVSDGLAALEAIVIALLESTRAELIDRLRQRVESEPVGAVRILLMRFVSAVASAGSPLQDHAVARLLEHAQVIGAACAGYAAKKSVAVRVRSDVAGLLLLVPVLDRLGWAGAIRSTMLWGREGPRSLTYVLAAIGRTLLEQYTTCDSRDIVVAVLAGWLDEAHWPGLERCAASVTPEECRDLLRVLAAGHEVVTTVNDWSTAVKELSHHLLREFAARIRGFSQSSAQFLVRKLLVVPGEVYIEERRLAVALDMCPHHVALHVSGAFEPVRAIGWLDGRDLVFHPAA